MLKKFTSNPHSIILVVILTLLAARPARAHPADMFFQEHTLLLSRTGIEAMWTIYPGGMLSPLVWSGADADQNQAVTPAEARAWMEANLAEFSLSLNGTTSLAWHLEAVDWPASLDMFLTGEETIVVRMSAVWPANLTGGRHHLLLHNRYQESISVNRFYLQASDGLTFHRPEQQKGRLQLEFTMAGEGVAPALSEPQTAWDSGAPLPSPLLDRLNLTDLNPETEGAQDQDGRPASILTGLVRSSEFSLTLYLVALVIALVLGALHALTPGHGKTVVAAYLVGARGTAWHAINLGAIVTATHTGSVFLLGLITLFASQYILPTRLLPMLEMASGLLIVGFGAHLLYRRWRAWRDNQTPGHHHHHHHDQKHHHHNHSNHHHHLPDKVTWRSLLALGVSGGLVPCPDAIAILLVALAINRIAFGLSLIVAFSLGLALVLIVIGLAMVHSRRLFEKMETFSRLAPALPLVSAVIVLGLGLWLTMSAITGTESSSTLEIAGLTPSEPVTDRHFNIDQAGLLYLAPDEQEKNQLFRLDLAGGEPVALTQESSGLWGYALSPDGRTIAYSTLEQGGRSDIWLLTLGENDRPERLPCPELSCSGLVWSPTGQRLIYEALNPSVPEASAGLPSLWSLDLATGETEPVFQDSNWPGFNAGWSADGRWLSYVYPGTGEIEIYHLADGRRHSFPNTTGRPVIWSPVDQSLLVPEVVNKNSRPSIIHLFRFDLESETLLDLSEPASLSAGQLFTDLTGAWSPDGAWIVVVRQEIAESGTSLGSHLWLMRADGAEARPLTTEPEVIHGTPVWSPDGQYLLFHRYSLQEVTAPPGIWMMNIHTTEQQEIVAMGRRPTWLP